MRIEEEEEEEDAVQLGPEPIMWFQEGALQGLADGDVDSGIASDDEGGRGILILNLYNTFTFNFR